MRRKQVQILTRDPVLASYLKEKLKSDPSLEIREGGGAVNAVIVETSLLTPAERELLQAIADYGSVSAAAQATHRSEDTAKNHMKTIRMKLSVHSTSEALVWGFRAGILR